MFENHIFENTMNSRIYNSTIKKTNTQFKSEQMNIGVHVSLVHGDDPQRCYGEGGGRGIHVWERM